MTATRRPANITSGDNCDDCHSTVGWIPANFDHVNITGNCISCHNGADATGKHPTHINTTDICEDCHNNVVWTPADMVDHTQVLGTCFSCHDGNTATGKHTRPSRGFPRTSIT
jgi:predicted CXXCH cytochrome family protein